MVETIATATGYGPKFLFLRSIRIILPLFLYSFTSFMYTPLFQSFIYQKACDQLGEHSDTPVNCADRRNVSSNVYLQKKANFIQLQSTVAMCTIGVVSSALVGRFGDTTSRKTALFIPFIGLLLSDAVLALQSYFFEVSVYWAIASEVVFAIFGGYMSIFSTFFAYASDSLSGYPPKCRSQIIAIMEGTIGLGGTFGYLFSFLQYSQDFTTMFVAFIVVHCICILLMLLLPRLKNKNDGNNNLRRKRDYFGIELFKVIHGRKAVEQFFALLIAFGISFFTFIGSVHISFFYVKYRFNWDAGLYGFLKGPTQGLSTLTALFLYPFLRAHQVTDRILALIGVVSRALGRLWFALAWNTPSVFLLIPFDSFSRFVASGIRSIMANAVPPENQGSLFALLAVTEALCNLLAALIFHTLFPYSIPFMPQLSFYILFAIMIIPVGILWLCPSIEPFISEEQRRREDLEQNGTTPLAC